MPTLAGELTVEGPAGPAKLRFTAADFIKLETVFVPRGDREHGTGTRLIAALLAMADGLGKPVRLNARGRSDRAVARCSPS